MIDAIIGITIGVALILANGVFWAWAEGPKNPETGHPADCDCVICRHDV